MYHADTSRDGRKRGRAMESRTVSISEAASILGISKNTAYRLVQRDAFPARTVRIGSQLKVVRADLDALVGSQPNASTRSGSRGDERPKHRATACAHSRR